MARRSHLTASASELRLVLSLLMRRLRAEHRLPVSHGAVLSRLEREGAATTSALAAAEHLRPQSVAQTIADLESAGLVSRAADPNDRRQLLITLTGRGQARLAEERTLREGWLANAIETQLTPDEQIVLVRAVELLRRLAES